jgi:hypothetical protein
VRTVYLRNVPPGPTSNALPELDAACHHSRRNSTAIPITEFAARTRADDAVETVLASWKDFTVRVE